VAQKSASFKLTDGDRAMLEIGPYQPTVFSQYYFDINLLPWQVYFQSYPSNDKLVIAGIRTWKSFGTADYWLKQAFWNPGSRWLNVCITADQAQIIFNDILMLAQSDRFKHWIKKIVLHPYPVLQLWNDSEIWSRSIGGASGDATTLRGWEFDGINIDEAAYVTNELAVMTLKGRLIGVNKVTKKPRIGLLTMTSTPKGAKSWLFERWKKGDSSFPEANPKKYLSLRARTYDNTFLSPEQIEEAVADYTEDQKRQELEGIFIADNNLFAFEDLMAMCGRNYGENILDLAQYDPDVLELEKKILAWYREKSVVYEGVPQTIDHYELDPEPNHTYIAGCDLGARAVVSGRAEGRNATVGTVIDISTRPWKLVAYRYDIQGRYSINMERVKDWHDKYNNYGRSLCHTRIDAVGPGDVIHQMLEEDRYRIDGFKAGLLSKAAMLQASAVVIERRLIRAPFIRRLVDQFQSYTPGDDKNIAQDIVISLSQGIHLARELEGAHSDSTQVRQPEHSSLGQLRGRARVRSSAERRQAWRTRQR